MGACHSSEDGLTLKECAAQGELNSDLLMLNSSAIQFEEDVETCKGRSLDQSAFLTMPMHQAYRPKQFETSCAGVGITASDLAQLEEQEEKQPLTQDYDAESTGASSSGDFRGDPRGSFRGSSCAATTDHGFSGDERVHASSPEASDEGPALARRKLKGEEESTSSTDSPNSPEGSHGKHDDSGGKSDSRDKSASASAENHTTSPTETISPEETSLTDEQSSDKNSESTPDALFGNLTTELTYHSPSIGNNFAKSLSSSLHRCPNLKILKFLYTSIGEGGAIELANGLSQCRNVECLDFDGNPLGDKAVVALLQPLSNCSLLRRLSLTGTGIGDTSAIEISYGLKHWKDLAEVYLDANEIGDAGASALSKVFGQSNLQYLEIDANRISKAGREGIQKAWGKARNKPANLLVGDEEDLFKAGNSKVTKGGHGNNVAPSTLGRPLQRSNSHDSSSSGGSRRSGSSASSSSASGYDQDSHPQVDLLSLGSFPSIPSHCRSW